MAIKLEVGKKYELNNGEVHECTKMWGDDPLFVDRYGYGPFVINGIFYHQDGTFASRTSVQEYSGVKRCVNDAPKLWRDMTPEEKGALLLAHHEGKTIELFIGDDGWSACSPYWADDVAYRVKPEPVVETISIYSVRPCCGLFGPDRDSDDTHRITFDVIDGVPDCASVKMEKL